MCVIVHKEPGVEIPTDEVLKKCFTTNSDGAGILIYRKDTDFVEIHKGYLKFDDFLENKNKLNIHIDDHVVFHFRITTSGGTCAENCHPFPISDKVKDLKALRINTQRALVHNGIIGAGSKDLSDTQLFVKDIVSNNLIMNNLDKEFVQKEIENFTTGNKYVLIDAAKNLVVRIGYWSQDTETKIWYSNRNHETYTARKSTYNNYGTNSKYYNNNYTGYGDYYHNKNYNGNYYNKDAKTTKPAGYVYYPDRKDKAVKAVIEYDCPLCSENIPLHALIENLPVYTCSECAMIFNIDEETYYDTSTHQWLPYEIHDLIGAKLMDDITKVPPNNSKPNPPAIITPFERKVLTDAAGKEENIHDITAEIDEIIKNAGKPQPSAAATS